MDDEKFWKLYWKLVEWEPYSKEKAREMLDRILKLLFGYHSQKLLEDKEREREEKG